MTFTTPRLTVYILDALKTREHFVGINAGGIVCVTATVEWNVEGCGDDGFLWHICTIDGSRRKGLARELWQGIEKHTGRKIVSFGETEAGLALCKSMGRVAG